MSNDSSAFRRVFPGAFTLIEMLVVIAVIALLAALLVPAVGRAMRSAAATKCAAVLSQDGKAFDLYVSDHDNHYPPYPTAATLSPTVYASIATTTTLPQIRGFLATYVGTKNLGVPLDPAFLCQGTMKLPPSFGSNVQYVLNVPVLTGSVQDATSASWLMMDADQTNTNVPPGVPDFGSCAKTPGHYTKWNVLYADEHTGFISTQK